MIQDQPVSFYTEFLHDSNDLIVDKVEYQESPYAFRGRGGGVGGSEETLHISDLRYVVEKEIVFDFIVSLGF